VQLTLCPDANKNVFSDCLRRFSPELIFLVNYVVNSLKSVEYVWIDVHVLLSVQGASQETDSDAKGNDVDEVSLDVRL